MRAYLALGGVYASKEDYRSAADLYERAVSRIDKPTREHWNIFYQRGIAYERLKEWPKAEPNFRKALELFPDQPQVLNYLGYSWVDMSMNLEEGLEMIRRAVELRPSDGYIVDSLGWAYFRLNRFEEAVTELERAVSLKPDDPILNDHLGDAYWRVGRRLEATFQWSHARDMKPEPDVLAKVVEKLSRGFRRLPTRRPPSRRPRWCPPWSRRRRRQRRTAKSAARPRPLPPRKRPPVRKFRRRSRPPTRCSRGNRSGRSPSIAWAAANVTAKSSTSIQRFVPPPDASCPARSCGCRHPSAEAAVRHGLALTVSATLTRRRLRRPNEACP